MSPLALKRYISETHCTGAKPLAFEPPGIGDLSYNTGFTIELHSHKLVYIFKKKSTMDKLHDGFLICLCEGYTPGTLPVLLS